jgi:glycosyltransferase involved in cell wall biosynthesis
MKVRPRIAVVSPFLDKRHGTERTVAEQLERLAEEFEFHIFSARVEDLDLTKFTWHRLPIVPGPQVIRYLWFLTANHFSRWWDRWRYERSYDLVYSPGINCLDADLVAVHVVFADLSTLLRADNEFRSNSFLSWPRIIHRRLYYMLVTALEHRVYPRQKPRLIAVSHLVAESLARRFERDEGIEVIYAGVDSKVFHPQARLRRRPEARRCLGLAERDFVLLLIGNGWRNKGLPSALKAISHLGDGQIKLLVVGEDDRTPYNIICRKLRLEDKVFFLDPSPDVLNFYAASDVYVGPSIYDSFAMPPAEAMACGLPVIVSRRAGVSEIITTGSDGFVLEDASDFQQLANLLRLLSDDPEFRQRLGEAAAKTASRFSWEQNAARLKAVLNETIRRTAANGMEAQAPAGTPT